MRYVVIDSGRPGNRIGIYALGGCDLRAVLGCAPLVPAVLKRGVCGIRHDGTVADTRSDMLLQNLDNIPPDVLKSLKQRLKLPEDYFQKEGYHRSFTAPGAGGARLEFEKNVVIMSIGPDVVRTVYRHKQNGLLVDPGGVWLDQSLQHVLSDPSVLSWFQEHFVSLGKIPLEETVKNFTTILRKMKEEVKARVLVLNTFTVDPGSLTHNYQFVRNPHAVRRREFNLALVELSRRLDFSIVDVDRIVKRAGIRIQLDFGHAAPVVDALLAQEVFRILQDLGVF
jgi:hypothetical protein